MPLVPTKMADAQCSVSGNRWPGGPRDMLTTTSARVNSSLAFLSHLQDDVVVSISRGPPGQWFPETEH